MNEFGLERAEEALAWRVVETVPGAAHAGLGTDLGQALAVAVAGVLAAPIRVVDESGRWPASGDGHVEGVEGDAGGQTGAHRPADDPAGEEIEHDREIEPALAGRDVSNVGQPERWLSR